MAGIVALVCFVVAFILYAAHAATSAPWTFTGFALLGLAFLALAGVWSWTPRR